MGATGAGQATAPPVLEMRDVSKNFDMTAALADVSLSLNPGEVHALVGELDVALVSLRDGDTAPLGPLLRHHRLSPIAMIGGRR